MMGRSACIAKSRPELPARLRPRRRNPLATALVLGCLACLVACADRRESTGEEEIVIGVIAPVASTFLRSGPPTVEGTTLAVKEINAAGGVDAGGHRRRIRLVVEDTEDRPETAVSKAFKLIGSDRVAALVGLPVSDSALAVAKVAEQHRVPMVTTGSTNPETTRGKSFAFRVIFSDPFQGRVMAEFAHRDLGARKAGVLFDAGSAYSRGLMKEFRASFESLGGEVAAQESTTADDPDASDRLLRIRQSGADVLVMPVYPALAPALMRQARESGITSPALGGDSWNNLAAAERERWSPAYFIDVWAPGAPGTGSRRFLDAYEQEYGKAAMNYAALAYDAIFLLARAIELEGSAEPEAIRTGLLALDDFSGVTGTIKFEGTGDPVRSAVIMRLAEDGSAHLHRKLDPAVRRAGGRTP